MAILNVGSINWDRVIRVPHFPEPGETLRSHSVSVGLGGKGLNQSVTIMRAGGTVQHVGAVGANDTRIRDVLHDLGLRDNFIVGVVGVETGSATILVDDCGENLIVLDEGANGKLPGAAVSEAVDQAQAGDWLLFQNETNQTGEAARLARVQGMQVAFSAAPFRAEDVMPLLGEIDLLSVNAVELAQLEEAVGGAGNLPSGLDLLVTRGSEGAEYLAGGERLRVESHRVEAKDTTGAGDVFLGVFLSELDAGASPQKALETANAAAALQVGKLGAVDAIPTRAEIEDFLSR
ncbi:ribokinase [Sulfitobacter sp. BDSS02]|nr:ribokinase [Sulfitobacter sp. BDSS02]MBR9851292.1 ribokinase [Paracoccaceae bacterium]